MREKWINIMLGIHAIVHCASAHPHRTIQFDTATVAAAAGPGDGKNKNHCALLYLSLCVGNDWGNWIFAVVCSYFWHESQYSSSYHTHVADILLACSPIHKPPEIMIAMHRCVYEICSYSVFFPPMTVCVLQCKRFKLHLTKVWLSQECVACYRIFQTTLFPFIYPFVRMLIQISSSLLSSTLDGDSLTFEQCL